MRELDQGQPLGLVDPDDADRQERQAVLDGQEAYQEQPMLLPQLKQR